MNEETINYEDLPEPTLVPELSVSNTKESLVFYVEKLGFRVFYERPEEGFAYIEREGAEIMLDQIHPSRSWLTGAMEKPFGRGINFQIKVSDVDNLRKNFSAHEIFLETETQWYAGEDVEYGVKQFIVKDPDGYLLRLQQSIGTRSSPVD